MHRGSFSKISRRFRLVSAVLATIGLVHGLVACAGRTPIEAPTTLAEPLQPRTDLIYRLQAGDTLAIKFWGNDELDEEQKIRPDGRISLPYIDEVQAAGLTPQELDAVLTERFSSELARPNLTVIVRQAIQPQVFVGGEVTRQGVVPLSDQLTLLRAVHQAGGFKTSARIKDILLIRLQPGEKPIARAVDLRPVMSGRDPGQDVQLQAYDIVFVPRTKIENINLFIDQYIDDIVPLQSVFGGLLLGSLASDENKSDEPSTPTTSGGGS